MAEANKKVTLEEMTEEQAADYIWKKLSKIDVNDMVDKKTIQGTQLTYLSWAKALSETYNAFPNMKYRILCDPDNGNLPYFDLRNGIEVRTEVTIGPVTREMWLPVMDASNTSLRLEPYTVKTKFGEKNVRAADANDINKAKMRCLVKNLAMFGLGIYIYAGEDLPMESYEDRENLKSMKVIKDQIKDLGMKNTKGMTSDQKTEYYKNCIVSVIGSTDFMACNDEDKLNKVLELSKNWKSAKAA